MKYLVIFIFSILCLSQSFSQWLVQNSGTGSNLKSVYFMGLTGYVTGSGGVVLRTTNGGLNWNLLTTGITEDINSAYFINFTTGYACGNSGKMIYTSNGGDNWVTIPTGVTDNLYAVKGSFCSGSNGDLLYTTNGGLSWVVGVTGFISTYYGIDMVAAGTAFACGVNTIFQPLVAKTTNGGLNWSYSVFYLNSNEGNLRDIHFINSNSGYTVANVWTGQGAISYTSNAGVNWSTQLYTRALNGIDFAAPTGYAVGIIGYILRSTNAGQTWTEQASGISTVLKGISVLDSNIAYAVGDGGVIIKTTNGGITAIEPVSNEIPNKYSLSQNFPNPFNPTTKIKFALPKSSFARIIVYDLLGREVAVLVNEQFNAGTYEADWSADMYSGGVYYYKLTSADFTETKKMILIK